MLEAIVGGIFLRFFLGVRKNNSVLAAPLKFTINFTHAVF